MPAVTEETMAERVRSVALEAIAEPLYLVDVVVRGRKGSRVVELFVDADEGLSVQRLADLSREIGFLLENEDVVDGRYNLNVSSPGVDRPLRLPRQFRKNVGREVSVAFEDDRPPLQGKLIEADDEGFTIGIRNRDSKLTYGDVKEVRVLLPW